MSKVMVSKCRVKAGICLNHPHRPKPSPFMSSSGGPSPWTSWSMLVFSVISTGMTLPPTLLRMLVQQEKEVSNYELTINAFYIYVQRIYIRPCKFIPHSGEAVEGGVSPNQCSFAVA